MIQAKRLPTDGAKAEFKRNKAKLLAARTVLKIAREEYSKVATSHLDFRQCMEDEIEGAANSLELYDAQRRLLQVEFFLPDENQVVAPAQPNAPAKTEIAQADRTALRDAYLSSFPDEKIKIRDVCWAVNQHYREWKRWLSNQVRAGSTADKAFRALLTSERQKARRVP